MFVIGPGMVAEAAIRADSALHVAHVERERLALALSSADPQLDRGELHERDRERNERRGQCVRHPGST